MAAACNVVEDEASTSISNDLLEAQIVAQAITELQEIQGPVVQHVTSGETTNIVSVVTDSGLGSGSLNTPGQPQTQVIYYIEDGTVSRTEDRTLVDSSVQANDYEIERRSGRVPSRKRVIPVKFRDYKHTSGDETSDSDYDPEEFKPRPRKAPKTPKPVSNVSSTQTYRQTDSSNRPMKAGRPRKNFMPTHTAKGEVISVPLIGMSSEIEQKYQEALKISRETAAGSLKQQQPTTEAGKQTREQSSKEEGQIQDAEGTSTTTPDHVIVKEDGSDQYPPVPVKRARGRPRGSAWERFYKCPDCGKKFNQKGNLRVHLRVHTSERPFPCQEEGCGKSFRSNESLRRHLLSHQGIKPFTCELCDSRFSSNVALIEHRSRHYDQKPHQCPHCQRKFRQVSCLRRHVMTHSGELPYMCGVCKRCFAQTSYLRSHMKVHTGEKPFKCEICNKRFAHQSDVKRHKTTHTGEKPYSCTKCQARFSDVSSKNRHVREHENNKRYTCQLCSDTFKRPGQLMSHLRRKHSHTFPVKIDKDGVGGGFAFKVGEDCDPSAIHVTQQKLVSLIKNLHSKTVTGSDGFTEIGNISVIDLPDAVSQSEVAMATDHVTDISQLEKEVDASVIESDMTVPIELQGVEIQGEEVGQTFIAITDLADSLTQGAEKGSDDKQTECRYRIIYEIAEDGQQKPILVPYNPAEDMDSLGMQVQYSQLDGETVVDSIVDSTADMDKVTHETILAEVVDTQTDVVVTQTDVVDTQAEIIDTQTEVVNTQTEMIHPAQTEIVHVDTRTEIDHVVDPQTEIVNAADSITEEPNPIPAVDEDNKTSEDDDLLVPETIDTAQIQNKIVEDNIEDKGAETDKRFTDIAEVDYVSNPDFSCQHYYNWLTNFTELCKVVPMPLDVSVFQKISQVHKTLSDVMATPSGVVADKENFRVLMNISRELSTIINEHLVFVLENLNSEDKPKEKLEDIEITNI